eukprot:GFUD01122280.1.p1 GENE.GFUD01122280.1~~GFUD01122280.1.p1  ORF type:complete len:191 (-),score=75.76 GFUD01122280.1:88-660(-)
MADNYTKLTVAELKQNLKERGVEVPSKTRKLGLVTRLLQEDANRPVPGGELSTKKSKVEKDTDGGSKNEKVWLVETNNLSYNHWKGQQFAEKKLVGVYTNKTEAIKNAKVAFTNMDMYEDMYNEEDDTFDENAKKMKRNGGVLCSFEGGEGEIIRVGIRVLDLNKEVKSKRDERGNEDYEDADDEENEEW